MNYNDTIWVLIGLNDWNHNKAIAVFTTYNELSDYVKKKKELHPDTRLMYHYDKIPFNPKPELASP